MVWPPTSSTVMVPGKKKRVPHDWAVRSVAWTSRKGIWLRP